MLMGHIQLATASDNAVKLQSQAEVLRKEEARLKISYEQAFKLTEIEKYAISELGMGKPRGDQMHYLMSSDSPEMAVVLRGSVRDENGFLSQAVIFLSGVGEYFR
jgi:hypothetical protein